MRLLQGDCREVLRTLADNSVDAVVCDPPYELGFMGKKWDSTGIAYDVTVWQECLRVLKPGGRLLAFGGTRTYHRLACAIEDAGFAIADQLQWLYGSGFPKSYNIAKGVEGKLEFGSSNWNDWKKLDGEKESVSWGYSKSQAAQGYRPDYTEANKGRVGDITYHHAEAQQWDGWGTALKPMHEPVCFALKPLEGTYAANVLKWGCGGLNIDGCRIGTEEITSLPSDMSSNEKYAQDSWTKANPIGERTTHTGRWPGNVLLDPEAAAMLDEQSGDEVSRFFYCAKVARWERDFGLDGFEEKQAGKWNPGGIQARREAEGLGIFRNNHPTVKPVSLLRWLCRLVTPPGGTVLDPFMGSGSCGIAAKLEGFDYIGIELDADNDGWIAIAEARIAAWQVGSKQDAKTKPDRAEPKPETQMPLPLEES